MENPYYQPFCGEEVFQHWLVFDRSSLTRWRQRMGEAKLAVLVQESLASAIRMGAARPADFTQVIVDTTVQEKAISFPTDARLMHRAASGGASGAGQRHQASPVLRAGFAPRHAKQFKRANKALASIRTLLGRVIRYIGRKIPRQPVSR